LTEEVEVNSCRSFSRALFLFSFFVAAIFALVPGRSEATPTCTHYASPTGNGNGLSASSPFKISSFWNVATPGKTLCLLDGVNTDSISPPENLNGTASAPITIKALNDGKVRIDGGGVRIPVKLYYNDYFVLEGFDAHNSSAGVISIGREADNNIVRRVCAWDAPDDTNNVVWGVHNNTGTLLEDVCGFGKGRKIFTSSQNGNNVTIRRAWGRWERSTLTGPKMVYSLLYNSAGAIYENVIGTWDESSMGSASVNQPYGILAMDRMDSDYCVNSKYLGSIAYLLDGQKATNWLGAAFGARSADCVQFKDIVVYIEPGKHSTLRPSFGQLFDGGSSSSPIHAPKADRRFDSITLIGGSSSSISNDANNGWQVNNDVQAQTPGIAPNIWNGSGSQGARVCKRYVNGTLTTTPLWPWPMNQRIIDATKTAGKTPVDVTATMEEIFGPIPFQCKTGGVTALPSPTNLQVSAQ
jgi:hypothetical protein